MQKLAKLYRGKAKTVYTTEDPDLLILTFHNDTYALDGQRIEQFDRSGMINNKFNYFIMTKLAEVSIPTQIVRLFSDNDGEKTQDFRRCRTYSGGLPRCNSVCLTARLCWG